MLLVHFVNRQLLYHTDELFQPYVLLFCSWRQEKNRLLKGEDDKGFSMRGQESKVLAKDEDDETILFVADLFLA